MVKSLLHVGVALTLHGLTLVGWAQPEPLTLTVNLNQEGKPISPDLIGVFFEDISYAADGGLYAELVQNRSFEYSPTEQPDWHPLKFWELQKRGGGDRPLPFIDKVEAEGAYINFYYDQAALAGHVVGAVLDSGGKFGRGEHVAAVAGGLAEAQL